MFDRWWKKLTLGKFARLQKEILAYHAKLNSLSEEELKKRALFWKKKVKKNPNLEEYLVPILALVREVIYRKIGLLLFPTQVFGAIVLHYGNIAQMNTGEGKTLTAFLPICLNALAGRAVYLITVNEYLASRDWKLGKSIFDFFGITSGFNSSNHSLEEKKKLYADCQVIYTTSSELGFDYLRNNLVTRWEDKLNLRFSYVILDEADLITIDESQNPLIISQRWGSDESIIREKHEKTTYLAEQLKEKIDYQVDSKDKELWLTKLGIKKAEKFYQITNLFSFSSQEVNFLLHNSLKAKHFYQRGIEYIVSPEKKIVIIDTLTGRLVPNRVYSAGIQQAVESKEGVPISLPSKSTAVITYQNFFRLFNKVAGMTGTAMTEAKEFRQVYGMEVIAIRPYRKLIRQDHQDLIFLDKESKYQAIIQRIKKNQTGKQQPILVGSPSLGVSERISFLLQEKGIFHYKLNAVNHQQEAEIIKQAGQLGALTISTNMAGRGTDIVLSPESRQAGGLLVIGVERNFSRRIDNQLRGRSGRQGDPGESQFYVSLEDELIKNYGVKEQITRLFSQQNLQEIFRQPLKNRWFSTMVAEPQEVLRNLQSSYRQHTLNYDLLINSQRQKIYNFRQKLLASSDIFALILNQKKTLSREIHHYLKSRLLKEIDFAWANYLESLERINRLVGVKSWLPQDPQEAFFEETSKLFQVTRRHLRKQMRQILLTTPF